MIRKPLSVPKQMDKNRPGFKWFPCRSDVLTPMAKVEWTGG